MTVLSISCSYNTALTIGTIEDIEIWYGIGYFGDSYTTATINVAQGEKSVQIFSGTNGGNENFPLTQATLSSTTLTGDTYTASLDVYQQTELSQNWSFDFEASEEVMFAFEGQICVKLVTTQKCGVRDIPLSAVC